MPTNSGGLAILTVLGLLGAIAIPAQAQQGESYSWLSYDKGETVYAYSDTINLRESPSTDAKVLTRLMTGDAAKVLERTDTRLTLSGVYDYWYKIDFQGRQGYVWGALLAKDVGSAPLEGAGSSNRILMQATRSYQMAVPISFDAATFRDSALPKLPAAEREVVRRLYPQNPYDDSKKYRLTGLDKSGKPVFDSDVPLRRADVLAAAKALSGLSIPGAAPVEFGISGKVALKAISGGKAVWELSYPFPRASAATPAENLLGLEEGLGAPADPDERFSADYGAPVVVIRADKGFAPASTLLSIAMREEVYYGEYNQAALYSIDAKGAKLVTTYLAGSKVEGGGSHTDLILPSDEGGQKNTLIFKSHELGDTWIAGRFSWNGSTFKRLP